ncbi:MAG: sensor histidine kinase [Thermoanaerobaculia bacterium]
MLSAARLRLHQGEPRIAWVRAGTCAAVVWIFAAAAGAQRLPLRCWGLRDGLAHAGVNAILQDALGYLWIGTGEGLSRFDGYAFRNFGIADGLGHPQVNALVEDDTGRLWVATNGGGVTLVDARSTGETGRPLRSFAIGSDLGTNRVNTLLFRRREIWLNTDRGVYRAEPDDRGLRGIRQVLARPDPASSYWLTGLRDSRGRFWFGVDGALLEVAGERRRSHPLPAPIADTTVVNLAERPDRSLLVTTHDGVYEFRPWIHDAAAWQPLPVVRGPIQTFFDLEQGPAGELWIASRQGLIRWHAGAQETFTERHGLPEAHVRVLERDRHGNLWIGTNASGLCRLAPAAITSYTTAEGLPNPEVLLVTESREGRLIAVTRAGEAVEVIGERVVPLPGASDPAFHTLGNRLLQDGDGVWWAGTGPWWGGGSAAGAVYRLPAGPVPDFRRAERVSASLGLPETGLYLYPSSLLEDGQGNLWFSMVDRGVFRRAPGGSRFQRAPLPRDGRLHLVDADGALWFTTYDDLRLWRDGRTWVLPAPGVGLSSTVRAMLRDRRGRLWIGFRYLGLGRVVSAAGRPPRIRRMTMADGLLSDAIYALAEDRDGRIWIGTGQGVQILDPESGRFQRLTMGDGLVGDWVNHLHADARGRVWVATATGLSRVDLTAEAAMPRPPPVYLTRVRAGGSEQPISPFGLLRLGELRLVEPRNDLLVEFVGVSFAREGELRYQYRLVGAGDRWSDPAGERVVNFARLAPGRYRLEVRAVNEEGVVSERPAEVSLAVVPPVWQRGWFVALVAAALAAVALWLHRQRVARLLALERVRSQIAADLHDDVGAGLSEIAILSEAARGRETTLSDSTLARVAERARSLRRALADTVWAVDPRRDRADELVRRMREVTHNLLGADEIAVEFMAPPAERLERVSMAPDQRRDLLFLFQELIHNAARHAAADRVEVELALTRSELRLTVRDDGQGFDPAAVAAGHGLASMRARAERLGGRLELDTAPGRGCAVELVAPLHP